MPKRAVDLDALQPVQNGINTYNEKSLHADLKQWYAQPADQLEVPVDGYVIDLVRGDLLVESQPELLVLFDEVEQCGGIQVGFPVLSEVGEQTC